MTERGLDAPVPYTTPPEDQAPWQDSVEVENTTNGSAVVSPAVHNISEAERRQLTVMFCGLADSTKLAQ
jgi:hypothetical protein